MDFYRTSLALNNLAITMIDQDHDKETNSITTKPNGGGGGGGGCTGVAVETLEQSIALMNTALDVHYHANDLPSAFYCHKGTLQKAERFVSEQQQQQQQQQEERHQPEQAQPIVEGDDKKKTTTTLTPPTLAIDDVDLENLYSLVVKATTCANRQTDDMPQLIPIRISSSCNYSHHPDDQFSITASTKSYNLATVVLQQYVTLLYNHAVANLRMATTNDLLLSGAVVQRSLEVANASFNMVLDILGDYLAVEDEEFDDDMDNDKLFFLTMLAALCCVGLMQCQCRQHCHSHVGQLVDDNSNDQDNNINHQYQKRLVYWMKEVNELYLIMPRNSSSSVVVMDMCPFPSAVAAI